ncbi:transcriptional repressor ILP1 [Telopea speciosissima]|uniref:transcriptional repressor ILP1 n=1 Tax=Telopea speciosissima TaxID=54955 RepID=UPI001CC5DF5B|nr:transcriptional repressor ILP1 [Telopea speciosissima]
MGSRSKNFRRRAEDDDVNGEDATTTSAATIKASSKDTLAKPKKHHQQAPKLLSFADEEDESHSRAFSKAASSDRDRSASRLSKSSTSSHKITSLKDRPSSASPSLLSNVQPQAGEYTKEKLRELQKNTRTLASSRPPSEPKPPSEPVVVLKGLVKPISTVEDKDIAGNEGDDEEELELGEKLNARRGSSSSFKKDKDETEHRLASMGIGKARDSSGSLIPDQATINAIRAQRERLRQSRAAAPDFISLDGGSNHGAAEGLSDEEPEFQGRIAMLGDRTDGAKGVFETLNGRSMEQTGLVKDGDFEVEDDEDEEEKIWEEEQFRKGLGKRVDDGSSRVSTSIPVVHSHTAQQQPFGYNGATYQSSLTTPIGPSIGGAVGVSRSAEVMSITQQAEVASQAIQENVRRLKESHGRIMSSMTMTDDNLAASLLNITALEKSLSAAGERFLFMQKLRDFVSVICEFLQDKAPFIEELEEQMQKLHEERASSIIERRAADNADEMVEVQAAVSAAMAILSKGGDSASVVAAATTASQAAYAAAREQSNLPVQLDEFGRDTNLQKRMDMMRRAEARKRKKARSESKRMSYIGDDSGYQHIEGESSTDESDSESSAYQSNRDLLLQTAEQIFSDASEEYSQLSVVKERFERWKKYYSSSYRDAYMSLSAPAIFSPYVRVELLKWDPLYEDADFNDMQWHSLLFSYGLPEDENDFNPDDADANLVPGLVEKIALPILHHEIAHCWDMLSTRRTKNAVAATNLVINYVPATSEALRELLAAIRSRLSEAITNIIVPTWTASVMKAVSNAARVAAYRFGMSVRLLRNICLWKDILASPVLENLALDQLLNGKILPHVQNIKENIHDAVTRTERIIASLSGSWAGPNVTGDRSSKLQPLVDYVLTMGKILEKKHASGVSQSETSGLARRLKKMLVELNEYDKARAISRTFQLREAL